jgi:hypothetical protein
MNLETLQLGIQWWAKEKPKWGEDFLQGFYEDLYKARPLDLDEKWWGSTVDTLWKWRAIRSPKPPNTKKEIRERGLERLKVINEYYHAIRQSSVGEPSLANMKWENIAPLFDVLCQIKGGRSPVLPSKLGHFLFPRLFIVIDNEATAIFPYEFMWRMLGIAWQEFREKDQAREILSAAIRKHSPSIHADYPFETKIAELWLIGYKHR